MLELSHSKKQKNPPQKTKENTHTHKQSITH